MDYITQFGFGGVILFRVCQIIALFALGRWLRDHYGTTAFLWLAVAMAVGLVVGLASPKVSQYAIDSAQQDSIVNLGSLLAAMHAGTQFISICGWTLIWSIVFGDSVRVLQELNPTVKVPLSFLKPMADHRGVVGSTAMVLITLSPLAPLVYLQIL